MQPSTLWNALRHFWLVLLIGVLVAVGAGLGIWFFIGPTHSASASVTLMPPSYTASVGQETPTRGNPLFYLSGLTQARDLVVTRLGSQSVASGLEARYPDSEYSVTSDALSSAPIVVLTVSGPYREPVLQQLSDLTGSVPVVLVDLQDELDVAQIARVRSLVVTTDNQTTVERKGQIRTSIAGFGLIVASATMAIAILERRRLMNADASALVRDRRDGKPHGQADAHERG